MAFTYTLYPMPVLCMHCKHFSPPKDNTHITNGLCLKSVTRNIITGRLEYFYADEAREKSCLNAKDFESLYK